MQTARMLSDAQTQTMPQLSEQTNRQNNLGFAEGYPSKELADELENKPNIVLGGCCIEINERGEQARWRCLQCDMDFY